MLLALLAANCHLAVQDSAVEIVAGQGSAVPVAVIAVEKAARSEICCFSLPLESTRWPASLPVRATYSSTSRGPLVEDLGREARDKANGQQILITEEQERSLWISDTKELQERAAQFRETKSFY